jgi:hypothetical protein
MALAASTTREFCPNASQTPMHPVFNVVLKEAYETQVAENGSKWQ